MTSLGRLVCTILVVALALAGCGSDDEDSSGSATSSGPKTVIDESRGRLGIRGADLDDSFKTVAKSLGRKTPESGVVVTGFTKTSPAKAAGLKDMSAHQNSVQDSDIIETVDGKRYTADELELPLPGYKAGDTVTLRVWPAQGERRDVQVPLEGIPDYAPGEGGYFPGG